MSPPRAQPVFLNLWRIHFPLPALLSIGHRLAGALLVVALWPALWLLDRSLRDPAGFEQVVGLLATWPVRLLLWLMLWLLAHHLLAGLRYLLLDLDIAVERQQARLTAGMVFIAGAIVAAVAAWGLLP